jgi:hypothetical protein
MCINNANMKPTTAIVIASPTASAVTFKSLNRSAVITECFIEALPCCDISGINNGSLEGGFHWTLGNSPHTKV